MNESPSVELEPQPGEDSDKKERLYLCDRCGFVMVEILRKVVCPNCGSRFDCSDLNIYFD